MSATTKPQREVFVSRTAFIMAAIGSAIGLGNIWRFPYVAYEGGGGAFIIPYLVALLTAGVPLLFFDYAMGHKFRSSAPLAFRSISRFAEPLGWIQTGISIVIAIYYAVIIGWAGSYMVFSVTEAWGKDAGAFFGGTFLKQGDHFGLTAEFVPGVLFPLILVWVVTLGILLAGVQNGIARFSKIFIPILVVMFVFLVVRALFLPGALEGLNAFFTPDFSKLLEPKVWVAAYGQIFFSLSVAFGIMITYASYLKKRTNLTGSGLTVAFSNSGFEVLAGVGVFAALGFMAHAAGTEVSKVTAGGPGLAFVAFPTLISEMPGGPVFGVIFFACLVFAGLTSLISIVQVPVAAMREKLGMGNRSSVLIIGGAMGVVSCLTMATVSSLNILDVVDNFVNNIGIVGVALLAVIVVGWVFRRLPDLARHLNAVSSFRIGTIWIICVAGVTPVILGYMLISQIITLIRDGYGKMPSDFVFVFGWGSVLLILVASIVLTLIPWPQKALDDAEAARRESEALYAQEGENK